MRNIFVELNGERDGKEVFNSIFCPNKKDVKRAVRQHLIDFFQEPSPEDDDFKDISKKIVKGGGAILNFDGSEDWIRINFAGFSGN